MIQLIYAIHHDGIKDLLLTVEDSFNVREWAEVPARRKAFDLLKVVKLEVVKLEV